jgi:hypothetical protein
MSPEVCASSYDLRQRPDRLWLEKRRQHIDGPGGRSGRSFPHHDEPERRRKEFLDGCRRDTNQQRFPRKLMAHLIDERTPALGSALLCAEDKPRDFAGSHRRNNFLNSTSWDRPVAWTQHGRNALDRLRRFRPQHGILVRQGKHRARRKTCTLAPPRVRTLSHAGTLRRSASLR